jgi:hypothetical protein
MYRFGNYSLLPDVILSNDGGIDIFIAKMSLSGPTSWATKIGGITSQQMNFINRQLSLSSAINVDIDNNIYITGQTFNNRAIFYNKNGRPVFYTGPSAKIPSNRFNSTFFAYYPADGI